MQTVRLIHGGIALATALFIVYGSWVPFQFRRMGMDAAMEQLRLLLDEPWRWRGSRADWAMNSLITLPLGFSAVGALLAGRRTGVRSMATALLALVGVICLSVTVELGQLWLEGRVTSLQDVAAQTIGAAGGIIGYLIGGHPFDEWAAAFVSERGPEDRTQWVLQAYVVGLIGYSMLPLDVVMSPGELARKFDSGRIELIPFTYPYPSLLDALYGYATQAILAVPVGMLGGIAYRRRGDQPRLFLVAVLLAVGVLIAIEAAQLLIVSRFTSTTDVLVGTVGAVVGVAVMRRMRQRHLAGQPYVADRGQDSFKWLSAVGVYAVVLAIVFWAPYDFTGDRALIKRRLEAFQSMPFVRMQGGSDIHSLFQVIRMVAWFAPLGALAAMSVARSACSWETRRIGFILAAAGVAGWAVTIELGQVLLPSRFADFSDVMVSVLGGWFGLVVTARLATCHAPVD